jgi:hypothetical protein
MGLRIGIYVVWHQTLVSILEISISAVRKYCGTAGYSMPKVDALLRSSTAYLRSYGCDNLLYIQQVRCQSNISGIDPLGL